MNPLMLIPALIFKTARALSGGTTLTWSELEDWITKGGGNPANCGVGYAGGQPRRSDKAYIQVIRTRRHSKWEVEAALFLGPHQPKSTRQTWLVDELDSRLTKKFGDDHRFMIKI